MLLFSFFFFKCLSSAAVRSTCCGGILKNSFILLIHHYCTVTKSNATFCDLSTSTRCNVIAPSVKSRVLSGRWKCTGAAFGLHTVGRWKQSSASHTRAFGGVCRWPNLSLHSGSERYGRCWQETSEIKVNSPSRIRTAEQKCGWWLLTWLDSSKVFSMTAPAWSARSNSSRQLFQVYTSFFINSLYSST